MTSLQQRVASPVSFSRAFGSRGMSALQAAAQASHSPSPSSLGRSHVRAASVDTAVMPGTAAHEGAKITFSEWSYFGFDAVISGLAELRTKLEEPYPCQAGEASTSSGAASDAGAQTEFLSCRFGGDRWRLEILRRQEAETSTNLSLYLACGLDDYYSEDITIPTSIMISVREPGHNRPVIWQTWGEHHFCHEREFWECHTFPLLSTLLSNTKVASSNSIHLSVQLQSPLAGPPPEVQDARHVPSNLLSGLSSLLDDKRTGDVQFIVYERKMDELQNTAISGTNLTGNHLMYRKRIIYAHSAVLRARSSYFYDMFSNDWLEAEGQLNLVRVTDCDYVSMYWLLSWLYTNSITFADPDGPLDLYDDFAGGALLSKAAPGYDWQHLRYASESESSDSRSTILGGLKEKEARMPIRSVTSLGQNKARPSASKPLSSAAPVGNSAGKVTPTKKRAATPEPLGRLSPIQSFSSIGSGRSPTQPSRSTDPHPHPARLDVLPSALQVYKMANRYILPDLADLALRNVVSNLTPATSFPMLLATSLYPDLYASIRTYCLTNYYLVSVCPEFKRCFQDIGLGVWGEAGGEVLFDLMTSLSPT